MGRRSYEKGNRFMLHTCRLLSEWWCGVPAKTPAGDLPFRTRTTSIVPIEGHWEGKGDILHRPDVVFPFAVECKSDERGKMDAVLEAPQWPVWEWWAQAKSQADRSARHPLLIFSRNRRKDYVMLDGDDAERMAVQPKGRFPVITLDRPGGERVRLLLWEDLARVRPAKVRRALKWTG